MTLRNITLVVHVLVFGMWLGSDVATFLLSRRVLDSSLAVPTRLALARVLGSIEIIARLCLPTMLASGLVLAINSSLIDLDRRVMLPVVIAAALWISLVWIIFRQSGEAELASRLSMIDLVIRCTICVSVWVVAMVSIVGQDGPVAAPFLQGKLLAFAAIMSAGIAIRVQLRGFAAAFGELASAGSTESTERALQSTLRRAQPLVGVIWGCLVFATVLAVTKSAPWE